MPSTKPEHWPWFGDDDILAQRPAKPERDAWQPLGCFVELEYSHRRRLEPTATVLLTSRECPFRCLMCDLWQYTTDAPTPEGAIPEQIRRALGRLDPASQIKLYNAGNFFDARAIPHADWPAIADLTQSFATVIVENHPRLVNDACRRFARLLSGQLEIALGLETVHPQVLARLNKRMTLDDFCRACDRLRAWGIVVRAFILLCPPFLDEQAGWEWTCRSIEFAFAQGVDCCVLIPTRAGNGIMEVLARTGHYRPPSLAALEEALAWGLALALIPPDHPPKAA
ncbi:MAG: radical SAM protein [Gemmataceae bacterium]